MTLNSSEADGSRASLGRADEGVCPHADSEERDRSSHLDTEDAAGDAPMDQRNSGKTWDRYVAIGAACASLISFLTYSHRGDILLFGDAVAHINIARRVFDSRTPGPLQLGTVWLPLPHLLMMPFVRGRWLWQTGIGGSLPSMVAFILGVVGIFRLARILLQSIAAPPPAS